MNFLYNEVIVNGLIDILIKEIVPLSYTALYKKLKIKVNRNLSHRDFSNNLNCMVDEKILVKYDKTGKRGSNVYYSLTEHSKKEHKLKILGRGEEFEKRRGIYHLLLYYDVFKRSKLLTKGQLFKQLREIGIDIDSLNFLVDINKVHIKDLNNPSMEYFCNRTRLIEKSKGVEIVEVENADKHAKKNIKYYVVIPGFTIDEFISYIDKLRKQRDPKPFTDSIPLIPKIYYTKYTKDEIKESIDLLYHAGLIKLVISIFHGETRYKITDDTLHGLFVLIRLIHQCQFELTKKKILHLEKPDDDDENFLMYFFGEKGLYKLSAMANESRRDIKETYDKKKIKEIKEEMKKLEGQQNRLIDLLVKRYGDALRTNKLLRDLIIR